MSDWAAIEASKLVEKFAIMKGDRLIALQGALEAAIATKLRIAKVAGGLDALHEVQTSCGVAS